jgi:hypothetical protein
MSSRLMRRATAAGAAVIGAAILCCCGSGDLPAGPFAEPRTPSIQCQPLAGHKVTTFGDEEVTNHGHATAVIDRVAFTDPKGLVLLRAWAVPTTSDIAGMSWGFPPPPYHLVGWQWNHRHLAAGARVPLAVGEYDRTNLLMVVRLAPGVNKGTAAAIDIWYHVGPNRYHFRTSLGLIVVNHKTCAGIA